MIPLPPRNILLNPGPLTTSEAVKRALVVPDLCPREPAFGRLLLRVRDRLVALAGGGPEHRAVLIAGPGTAAIEAALSSLCGPRARLLILANGAYGERAGAIAASHRIDHQVVRQSWREPFDTGEVSALLEIASPRFTHCYWVHHETTTGLINPLAGIAESARNHGVVSIVDAMSSLGGLPVHMEKDQVDVLISSANKCLQGLPGLAFVLAPLPLLLDKPEERRSVALDLHLHFDSQEREGQFPFTPPVQILYGLDAALSELEAEGLQQRIARYRSLFRQLVDGMRRLGFQTLLPEELHGGLLASFLNPAIAGWSFDGMHDSLQARRITIYPGKIQEQDTFRLAVIGDLHEEDIDLVLNAIHAYLSTLPSSA